MNLLAEKLSVKRCLGRYSNEIPGPTIICICSIHGNEPSGTLAYQQVFNDLNYFNPNFSGELYGFAGNREALLKGVRYMQEDLNRLWTQDHINILESANPVNGSSESLEQADLFKTMHKAFDQALGPIYVIDLHTTSAESTPFISINDTIRNRDFALEFPLPIILGIEEYLKGTILNYINELGYIALGFEAGQHVHPNSIEVHKAAIWLTLFNSGCLAGKNSLEAQLYYQFLKNNSSYAGQIFDVQHRHGITARDEFHMEPGFSNLQKIKKKQIIARDKHNEIRSSSSGRIFMPLYQKQGNDGYFIVRHIKFFWLGLSKILRGWDFHVFLHMLPGITTHDDLKHTLVINASVAKWHVRDFLHLLGFRRKLKKGDKMIFIKREFDTIGPE